MVVDNEYAKKCKENRNLEDEQNKNVEYNEAIWREIHKSNMDACATAMQEEPS